MKIVILDAYTTNPGDLDWNAFQELGELVAYDRTSPSEIVARAFDADAVLTNKVVLNAETLQALPKLRYVGVLATGYNVVDLPCARDRGIVATNVPQYSTESVVQTTFAHVLNLASRVAQNSAAVKRGAWTRCADFTFSEGKLTELFGKRLGIVGFGTIGRRVAQVARAFGLDVVAYGPRLTPGEIVDGVLATSLEELFATSDVVTLHCPLTERTRGLVSSDRIATMKRGALLINTGRGPLLDEQAVADALRDGRLGGLGADVLSTEPPQASNPLLDAPNCYLTPHTAWASFEARKRLIQIAADNLRSFVRLAELGQDPFRCDNCVDR